MPENGEPAFSPVTTKDINGANHVKAPLKICDRILLPEPFTDLFVLSCIVSEALLEVLRIRNLHTLHFIVKKYVRGFAISDFLPLDSGIWRYGGFNDAGQLHT